MAEKGKILAIEDDPEMVEFIKTILEAHSYKVYSAPTQKEGLEKVKEVSPDLIILDVMLETKGAGFWAAHKLKRRILTPTRTVVLLLSGSPAFR